MEELNNLILREVEFSGALATITRVDVQKDLEYADIFVAVVPKEKDKEAFLQLEKQRKRLQYLLLRRINIKPMPELRFQLDTGSEKAAETEKVFLKLEKKSASDDN